MSLTPCLFTLINEFLFVNQETVVICIKITYINVNQKNVDLQEK